MNSAKKTTFDPALPLACAWWWALAVASLALSLLAPGGSLCDPRLPPAAGGILVLTELAILALAVLVVVGLSSGLARFRRPVPPALRWIGRGLRAAFAGLALLGFAGSWGSFWYTGHFLDREAVAFLVGDLPTVLGYAAGMNGALFAGIAILSGLAAVAASELLPRWIARCRPNLLRRFTQGSILAAASCAVGAFGGNLLYGKSLTERRDFGSGPSSHLLAELLERPEGPPGAGAQVRRRPIVPYEINRDSMNRWSVVVVLVDSLRADQLRILGASRDVLPAVDRLARESRVFTDCLTTATHTDYAVPSALSSHYPLRARTSATVPRNPTYPRVLIYDLLKGAGYRTAIFSSQDERWREMNHYLDTGTLDRYVHAASDPDRLARRPRTEFPEGTIDDAATVGKAIRWIDEEGSAPFFVCLNLQNGHAPYHVPPEFARPFGPATRDFPISFGWFPREKTPIVKNLYADSLAYVDSQLARLFGHLRERGLWDRTILVVTADHGEAFYEHDVVAHGGPLYGEETHVPLILHAPGLLPGLDSRPAQILDIPPTLCQALGLPEHPAFQGRSLLAEPSPQRSRFMVVQTPFARQYAIVRGGKKLIYDAHRRRSMLFDLASDPEEKLDLSEGEPELRRDLQTRLGAWYRAQIGYYEDRSRHRREYPPLAD